jgi:hypothetical protein
MGVVKIERHSIDMRVVSDDLPHTQKMVAILMRRLPEDPTLLGRCISAMQECAILEHVVRADADAFEIGLEDAAILRGEMFACAVSGGRPRHVELSGERYLTVRDVSRSDTGVNGWLGGYYASAIVQRRDILNAIVDVPESLLRSCPGVAGGYMYGLIKTLRALWKRSPDIEEHLQAAFDATDPTRLPEDEIDWVLNIVVQELGLIEALIEGSSSLFNERLEKALLRHKHYYSAQERCLSPSGFIALGPLALTLIAYQRGCPISVESDYIPRDLYEPRGAPSIWGGR